MKNTKKKGNTIEAISQNAGSQVSVAESMSFSSLVIPNLGNEVKIIGAALNKQLQGKVSADLAGASGVFVVKGESIYAKASLNGNADMQRKMMVSQIQQQLVPNQYRDAIMDILRKAADIKDYRSQVY